MHLIARMCGTEARRFLSLRSHEMIEAGALELSRDHPDYDTQEEAAERLFLAMAGLCHGAPQVTYGQEMRRHPHCD
jgi:hypothetical protein